MRAREGDISDPDTPVQQSEKRQWHNAYKICETATDCTHKTTI